MRRKYPCHRWGQLKEIIGFENIHIIPPKTFAEQLAFKDIALLQSIQLEEKLKNTVSIDVYNALVEKVNVLITNHNKLAETVSEIKENY